MKLNPWRRCLGRAGALAALALALSGGGCTYSHGSEPGPCNDPTPSTYAAVIAPIVAQNCLACHGSTVYQTLGGGNDYSSYQSFTRLSAAYLMSSVRHEPGADPMPKGGTQLSDCDLARLQAWVDAGRPNN
ncbi:MAG: cytochrome c [Bacteroidota bacterium]|nr:cytochrome c [Bacteroidota bacterium]